jgi:hypothetical protein
MLLNWERYSQMRWKAQQNLYQILRYQGIELSPEYNPQTLEAFKAFWGEKLDLNERTGVFERDARAIDASLPDGRELRIYFISSDLAKSKIPKKTIASHLLEYLRETTGMDAQQAFGGPDPTKNPPNNTTRGITNGGNETNQERSVSVIQNRWCILVSYGHLDGAAKNEITKFNQLFQYPIRHFTIDELQFDPTMHALGPKKVEILTQAEVDALIARSRGLKIGQSRLVPDYEEQLENLSNDDSRRTAYIEQSNEEILNKLQTTNTSNPWVKWRGYKVGDVLRIYRRVGNPLVVYRRVVLVEPMALKPPKVKTTQTNL